MSDQWSNRSGQPAAGSYDTSNEWTTVKTGSLRYMQSELDRLMAELAAVTAERDALRKEKTDIIAEFPPCECCDRGNHGAQCTCFDGPSMWDQVRALRQEVDRLTKLNLELGELHLADEQDVRHLTRRCEKARELAEEVGNVCRCRCEESWTTRGLHAPECDWHLVDMAQKWLEGKP